MHYSIYYNGVIGCMEISVDPDQLASLDVRLALFNIFEVDFPW